MSKLKTLIIQNMSLTDMTYITNNVKNITTLDVSNNPKLFSLKNSMNNLAVLNQISSLILSGDDLSSFSPDDATTSANAKILANLVTLTELDVSRTKISDAFLNQYFSFKPTLTKFVDRNSFVRGQSGGCDQINTFSDSKSTSSIIKVTTLTDLDVSGNTCFDTNGYHGTTDLGFIAGLSHLTHLDISHNGIDDLSALNVASANPELIRNLTANNLVINDLGSTIPLAPIKCLEKVGDGSSYTSDCMTQLIPPPQPRAFA